MRPGFIVQQRTFLAKPASWMPPITRALIFARWCGWAFIGWPITMLPIILWVAAVVILPAVSIGGMLPWGMLWGGLVLWLSTVFSNRWGWLVAASTFGAAMGAWAYYRTKGNATAVTIGRWTVGGAIAGGLPVWTSWQIGLPTTLVLWVAPFLLVWIDMLLPRYVYQMGLVRSWAQWNREAPSTWALVASQTKSVQSSQDGTVEQNVALSAKLRPIFEHPARWFIARFDFENWTTEQLIFAPGGRTMGSLNEVLPAWSAAWPSIENYEGSMELVGWDNSDNASYATLKTFWARKTTPENWPRPGWLTPNNEALDGSDPVAP